MLSLYLGIAIVVIVLIAYLIIKWQINNKNKVLKQLEELKTALHQKDQYIEYLSNEVILVKNQQEMTKQQKEEFAKQMDIINQSKTKEGKDEKVSNAIANFFSNK